MLSDGHALPVLALHQRICTLNRAARSLWGRPDRTEAAVEELFDSASVHKLLSLPGARITHPLQLQLTLASQMAAADVTVFPDGSDGHLLVLFAGTDRAPSGRQLQRNMALVQANEDLALVARDLSQGTALSHALIRGLQDLTRTRAQLLLQMLGDLHVSLEGALHSLRSVPDASAEQAAIGRHIDAALACLDLLHAAIDTETPALRKHH